MQADRRIWKRFFANASLVQRIVLGGPGVDRANLVSLIPRLEYCWLEAALPLLLYQYSKVRLGAAIRLGPLSLGSDNVLSIFVPGKFTGTDLYLSLRIFWCLKGRSRSGGRYASRRYGDLPCSFVPYRKRRPFSALSGLFVDR